MRKDQLERLEDLSEKLADRFLSEADPTEWPDADKDASREDRGDAYWLKKNAMATGGVLRYTLDLLKNNSSPEGAGGSAGDGDDTARDSDMDRKIAEAEKRAAQAVTRALDKAKKRTFDERTLGKR